MTAVRAPHRQPHLTLLIAAALLLAGILQAQGRGPVPVNRFQSAIDSFAKADAEHPPVKGGIVFTGSSIFRRWTHLGEQMAPLPVLNRAFGGSRTQEVLHYLDDVVVKYDPRLVVYYCGSNDINGGVAAEATTRNILAFFRQVEERLPSARMFFVSIHRAPQKESKWAVVDSVNNAVQVYCSSKKNCVYIDVNPIFFDSAGRPRLELFLEDKLHLRDQAYEQMAAIVKPVLETAWKEKIR